jgi:hypothetical protein
MLLLPRALPWAVLSRPFGPESCVLIPSQTSGTMSAPPAVCELAQRRGRAESYHELTRTNLRTPNRRPAKRCLRQPVYAGPKGMVSSGEPAQCFIHWSSRCTNPPWPRARCERNRADSSQTPDILSVAGSRHRHFRQIASHARHRHSWGTTTPTRTRPSSVRAP